VLLATGYTGDACDTLNPELQPNYLSPMGVEVAGPSYWSTQWIFIDVMKQSSPWMTQHLPDT